MAATVQPANQADLPALTAIDLTYTTRRLLSLERSGAAPELTFEFRWSPTELRQGVYDQLDVDGLETALDETDLFLVAKVDEECAGYLMVVLPDFTDAGEITDLAVHRPLRGHGVGKSLVDSAAGWARNQGLRALWVEPGADMEEAVGFYISLGFRVSGFNDRMYSNQDEKRPTLYMYLEV